MKKKLLLIAQILVVVLLIAAALYFIPYPMKVDMEMQGAVVTADGEILEQTNITIKGRKLCYLFQEDEIQLRIEATNDAWKFPYSCSGPVKDQFNDYPYITIYTGFIEKANDSSWGGCALNIEDGYFFAGKQKDPSTFLIGTTGSTLEPASLLDYFSDFINFYFPAE